MSNTAPANAAFQRFVVAQSTGGSGIARLSHATARLRPAGYPDSAWWHALEDRFNELTSLPLGWDGYAGQPVAFTCATFAAQLLERLCDPGEPPPALVPGSDGTLQIEWHRDQYDIEVDVLGPYRAIACRHDCLTDGIEEVELGTDYAIVASWMADMKARRVAAPPEKALAS